MSKIHHYKNASMKFYNKNEELYLETDASGNKFRVGFLQVRERMWFPKDGADDNCICKHMLDQHQNTLQKH